MRTIINCFSISSTSQPMVGIRTFPWKSFQLTLSLKRFRFHLHQILVNNLPTFDEIFCHAPMDKSLFRPLNLSRINEARFNHGPVGLVEHVCRMYSHLDVNMNTDRDTNINTNTDTVMNNMGEKAGLGCWKSVSGGKPSQISKVCNYVGNWLGSNNKLLIRLLQLRTNRAEKTKAQPHANRPPIRQIIPQLCQRMRWVEQSGAPKLNRFVAQVLHTDRKHNMWK